MKKIFFFAAALVAAVSMNAEVEVAKSVDAAAALGLTTDATDCAAGAVFYTGTNIDVKNVFATQTKIVNVYANDYNAVDVNGTVIALEQGLQGADNPKDADGGNPATTLTVPAQGAVLGIDAKADGTVLVFHKASSNKNYAVWEEGTAIGYDFVMQTTNDTTFNSNGLLCYSVIGDAELNQVKPNAFTVESGNGKTYETSAFEAAGIQWPELYYDYAWPTHFNGLGVIAFNVYEDLHYYVHAAGSKISHAAIVFVPAGENITVTLKGKADAEVVPADLVLYTVEATGLNDVEAVKAIKKMVNGQLVIEKNGVLYNVLGAQL